jgi:hypothetical protein
MEGVALLRNPRLDQGHGLALVGVREALFVQRKRLVQDLPRRVRGEALDPPNHRSALHDLPPMLRVGRAAQKRGERVDRGRQCRTDLRRLGGRCRALVEKSWTFPETADVHTPMLHLHTRVQSRGDSSKRGVVRYVGPVPTDSRPGRAWIGVEWDEDLQGLHDGQGLFSCAPTRGSFVKPDKLVPPIEFRAAVALRYDDATDLERVKALLANDGVRKLVPASQLSVLSVADSACGLAGDLRAFARATSVDLSRTLITWQEAVQFPEALRSLAELNLADNRLRTTPAAEEQQLPAGGLRRLQTLVLDSTRLAWAELPLEALPQLENLHFARNAVASLARHAMLHSSLASLNLQFLDLSDNRLARLDLVLAQLQPLTQLSHLVLRGNPIVHAGLTAASARPPCLRTLSLSDTLLNDWADIYALHVLRGLQDLRVMNLPLFAHMPVQLDARMGVIARLAGIRHLNGSQISAFERVDAERWFLKQPWALAHPERRNELAELHGEPVQAPAVRPLQSSAYRVSFCCPAKPSVERTVKGSVTVAQIKSVALRLFNQTDAKVVLAVRGVEVPVPSDACRLDELVEPDGVRASCQVKVLV